MIKRSLLLAAVAMLLTAIPAAAQQSQAVDLTNQFRAAGVNVDRLLAVSVGDIVVLRGQATNKAQAEDAARVAQSLGYSRVANLIQINEPADDAAIMRLAERELARHRSLDGTKLTVDSQNGIVLLGGKVQSEMQRDMATSLLRRVNGVREVKVAVAKF